MSLQVRGDYIKDWQSHSTMTTPDGTEIKHRIRVNEPLIYNGFYYYQSSYSPQPPYGQEPDKWYTILRVAKDPGLPLVYFGIFLMSLGMIWSFYIGPRFKKGAKTNEEVE
jgi:cytochrome c biogenesis protein ResB